MTSAFLREYLPWLLYAVAVFSAVLFFGRAWVRRLFESEGEPSIRKVGFFLVVVGVLKAADLSAEAIVNAVLIFAGTLAGLGTGKLVASRFAARAAVPDVDNSTTQIKADSAPVTTQNATITTPTDGAD